MTPEKKIQLEPEHFEVKIFLVFAIFPKANIPLGLVRIHYFEGKG